MKYSISNWIYGNESLEKTFERLSKYGYGYVELEGEPKKQKYTTEEVKRLLQKYGLQVSGIAGIFPWPTEDRDLASAKKKVRKQAINYVKGCIDFAKEVKGVFVNILPSSLGKPANLAPFDEEWKWVVDSLKEIGEYAKGKDILISIEPINRYESYFLNNADQALQLISDVDSSQVKIMLDCFHMNIEEPDPPASIRKVGKDLINIHIADSNREATGRGHIDFKAILRALKDIDYQYCLTLEPLPPLANPYIAQIMAGEEEVRDQYAEECISLLKLYERLLT